MQKDAVSSNHIDKGRINVPAWNLPVSPVTTPYAVENHQCEERRIRNQCCGKFWNSYLEKCSVKRELKKKPEVHWCTTTLKKRRWCYVSWLKLLQFTSTNLVTISWFRQEEPKKQRGKHKMCFGRCAISYVLLIKYHCCQLSKNIAETEADF